MLVQINKDNLIPEEGDLMIGHQESCYLLIKVGTGCGYINLKSNELCDFNNLTSSFEELAYNCFGYPEISHFSLVKSKKIKLIVDN